MSRITMISWIVLAGAGCPKGGGTPGGDTQGGDTAPAPCSDAAAVTWHKDIAPIVSGRCMPCHGEGGIGTASFSRLDGYAFAAPVASLMKTNTASKNMPPWPQDETTECPATPHPIANDLKLTDAQIAAIGTWADTGTCEGDAATAAPLPEPPGADLELPETGGDIVAIDMQDLGASVSFDAAASADELWCILFDPGLADDVYVNAVQFVPGNDKINHHAVISKAPKNADYAALGLKDGKYPCFGGSGVADAIMVGGWVPGASPTIAPPDTAFELLSTELVIVQIHYHPVGSVQADDQSGIRLRWTKDEPVDLLRWQILGIGGGTGDLSGKGLQPGEGGETLFEIAVSDTPHSETVVIELAPLIPKGFVGRIWGLIPHMHLLGSDIRVEITRPAGKSCLVESPRWDFQWQRFYAYDVASAELPTITSEDKLTITCTYLNSLKNEKFVAYNLENVAGIDKPEDIPLQTATAGESSTEEMCLFAGAFLYPNPKNVTR